MQLVKIHAQKYAKYELSGAKKESTTAPGTDRLLLPYTAAGARGSEQYPRRYYLLWNTFIYCNP
jgi:hypothetical protein